MFIWSCGFFISIHQNRRQFILTQILHIFDVRPYHMPSHNPEIIYKREDYISLHMGTITVM